MNIQWDPVAKGLLVAGLFLIVIALVWQFAGPYFKLGRLPGDIAVERENFKFYFPLATSLVLSAVISLIVWLFRWWNR